jgi:hypothetical protein
MQLSYLFEKKNSGGSRFGHLRLSYLTARLALYVKNLGASVLSMKNELFLFLSTSSATSLKHPSFGSVHYLSELSNRKFNS